MTPQHAPAETQRSEKENQRRSRQLFTFGVVALLGALCYYGFTAKVSDPFHLYEGLLIFALAALPALRWAKRGDTQLPVFEVQMITGISTFALPLLNSHEKMAVPCACSPSSMSTPRKCMCCGRNVRSVRLT